MNHLATTARTLLIASGILLAAVGCSNSVESIPTKDIISFLARNPATRITSLYSMRIDGTELLRKAELPSSTSNGIAITGNGQWVFFIGKSGSELPLFCYDIATSTSAQVSVGTGAFPTPSPTSAQIAWFEMYDSQYRLVVAQPNGTGRTVLIDKTLHPASLIVQGPPAWSPSGRFLAVVGNDTTASGQRGGVALVVDVIHGTITRHATIDNLNAVQWLSDGQLVYVNTTSRGTELKRFELDSSMNATTIATLPRVNSPQLSVSPKQTHIACANPLVIVTVATGTTQTIQTTQATIHDYMWSPQNDGLVFSDRSTTSTSSERLYHVSQKGVVTPLPHIDSLGSSTSAVWLR